jgi:RES domain-containing protein
VSTSFWRIGTDTPNYTADDRAGKGAESTGGRWNEVGVPMVYSASSRALACLETIVHLNGGGLPLNRYLVEVIIPDALIASAEARNPTALPEGWDAESPGRVSITLGSDWVRGKSSAVLFVPSVIVPGEQSALINPAHPDAPKIQFHKCRKWLYDPRLRATEVALAVM